MDFPLGFGRFAPSPSGFLHVGNLRTALLAWLYARHSGRGFLLRIEDIDRARSREHFAQEQLADLHALGLDSDVPVLYQHDRDSAYQAVMDTLPTYECFCSRKDILNAARAPHSPPGAYPGTCRNLSEKEKEAKRKEFFASRRSPAIRLKTEVSEWTIHDKLHGEYTGVIDDFVLKRDDWAYNLAVVIDDHDQNVTQVVRGEDLLSSTPRQAYLAYLLGYSSPEYIHVPLMKNSDGTRMAKRNNAPRLMDMGVHHALGLIAHSLGLCASPQPTSLEDIYTQWEDRINYT